MSPLARPFFARDARIVARALVGTWLVHRGPRGTRIARVVETEAYRGPRDAACHARFGVTARTRSLFLAPGHAYVYLVYGLHELFNVTCLREGAGHAVLLRAIEPVSGFAEDEAGDGPGKLTRALGLARRHDGFDLCGGGALGFVRPDPAAGLAARRARLVAGPRVGVGYAGEDAELPLRFVDVTSRSVSRPPRAAVGLGRPAVARR